MKHLLLLFAATLCCFAVQPARAQYIFIDANGDGRCGDFLPPGDPPVDVYLDTAHNGDGSVATCPTGEPLSFSSYEIIFHRIYDYGGSVTFGAWANAVPQFTVDLGRVEGGDDLRVGFSAPFGVSYLPPGLYKLGTLTVTMHPCSHLVFAATSTLPPDGYITGFYSACPGRDGDYLMKLGADFDSECGVLPALCSGVQGSTWGRIKQVYR